MAAKDPVALQERVERYLRTRSREDLGEVMEYSQPFIKAAVRNFGNCEADREDFCSEANISILKALDLYRGEAKFSTMVHMIAKNSAISYLRRVRKGKRESLIIMTLMSLLKSRSPRGTGPKSH